MRHVAIVNDGSILAVIAAMLAKGRGCTYTFIPIDPSMSTNEDRIISLETKNRLINLVPHIGDLLVPVGDKFAFREKPIVENIITFGSSIHDQTLYIDITKIETSFGHWISEAKLIFKLIKKNTSFDNQLNQLCMLFSLPLSEQYLFTDGNFKTTVLNHFSQVVSGGNRDKQLSIMDVPSVFQLAINSLEQDDKKVTQEAATVIMPYFKLISENNTKEIGVVETLRQERYSFGISDHNKAINFYIAQTRSAIILYRHNLMRMFIELEKIYQSILLDNRIENTEKLENKFIEKIFELYGGDIWDALNQSFFSLSFSHVKSKSPSVQKKCFYLYKDFIDDPALKARFVLNGRVMPEDFIKEKALIFFQNLSAVLGASPQQLNPFIMLNESDITYEDELSKLLNDFNFICNNYNFDDQNSNLSLLQEISATADLSSLDSLKLLMPIGIMPDNFINKMVNLKNLNLSQCSLTCWPSEIASLEHLESLNLSGNIKLIKIGNIPASIEKLSLDRTGISQWPEGTEGLNITDLSFEGCQSLVQISSLPQRLLTLNLGGTSISNLPVDLFNLTSAKKSSNPQKQLDLKLSKKQLNVRINWGEFPDVSDKVKHVIDEATTAALMQSEQRNPSISNITSNLEQFLSKVNSSAMENTSLKDKKAAIVPTFLQQLELLDLECLLTLSKILVQIQLDNINSDSVTIEGQSYYINPFVALRKEQDWFRSKAYGNTSSWQTIITAVKNSLKKQLKSSFPENSDLTLPSEQGQASLAFFKLHRSRFYSFGRTKSQAWYEEQFEIHEAQIKRKITSSV